MPAYPTGTVAFLFTDIEGSTRRWEARQQAMWSAVERHFDLLRETISAHSGVLFKTVGDAVQAAFPTVPDAIAAAIAGQRALHQADWGDLEPLRVRMAIHVGAATPRDGDYLAPALNRLARVLSVGYGEQILLTEAAMAVAGPTLTGEVDVLDLGAHRLRDLLQAEHIYQLRAPGLATDFPPLQSLDRLLHNLPAQPTPLLGRETELAAARALLQQGDVRLVTLTGPGGTGKTRLGSQTGAELLESFPDGVWFVPLAAISDPELVVPAIAQPLGVRENPDEPLLETLQGYLHTRIALLLLDNFEHVVAAAPDVASLLAACPKLKVLATSREPLRIAGERELPVPPLSLPTARQARHLDPGELLQFSAIRLFVERAQSVKPDFALTDANAADVAAICLRLDGLPLAIELAAARIRILPPAQLLARLDNRLKLLTGGARDLPARQQTLRAAIEWSHDLLSSDDQTLFSQLSVFAGGCTLEAAEAVCADVGGAVADVLDGLDSLVQKSLIRQDDDESGRPRFSMLETIREYGLDQLDSSGEAETVRRAHADYFLALAEQAEPELDGADQAVWLEQLAIELDNLRAALGALEQPSQAGVRLRLAGSLWRFWWIRGHFTEGLTWIDRALNEAQDAPVHLRAKALGGAGLLAESQGRYDVATSLHEQALHLRRGLGDEVGAIDSLANLGMLARVRGDYERARALQEQVLAYWQRAGNDRETIGSLHELGVLALHRGDYPTAETYLTRSLTLSREHSDMTALGPVLESLGILAFSRKDFASASAFYEEGLQVSRALGDMRMVASSMVNLGEAEQHRGDFDRAATLYLDALSLFNEVGEKRGTAFVLGQLGRIALAHDNPTEATVQFSRSLELRRELGETPAMIESLEGLAVVAHYMGDASRVARLIAATSALRDAADMPLAASYTEERDRMVAAARNVLGDSRFASEWAAGKRLSLEEAGAAATSSQSFQAPASATAPT